jgi:3-methyladenine DNA glycosylase AlkC
MRVEGKVTESKLFKDGLGERAVGRIGESLERTLRGFPRTRFEKEALDGLSGLELKDRVRHIVGVMHGFLPGNFPQAARVLVGLKKNWVAGDPDDKMRGFAAWPVIDYVGEYGLAHPDESLSVLRELTSFFSAEFAIRPFIIEHPDLAFRYLETWTADPDEHVRRLVSEGSRPRLPWGQQIPASIADPSAGLALLERLKDDPSEYVRRSVANHLNDVSKDHPDTVVKVCRNWLDGAGPERQWIIRHAARTLVKAGHPAVFGLLGYTENPEVVLDSLNISPRRMSIGESVTFKARLRSESDTHQKFVVDYAVHHVKANGKTTPKVFKFKSLELAPGETMELVKKHTIRPISTRRYYPGEHAVEILVNGRSLGLRAFTLLTDPALSTN